MSKSSSFDESLDGLEVFDVPEMTLDFECQSWWMVKFEHFDHAKLWKHTQHDIIYNLMGFIWDYVTESLGQNPKFTLC